ncbi:MAG: hypothetical protein IMZ46_04965, partial [Acidobacteria bacterium]|nr:hypothetical protein [Acidobacteriota bacterium]
MKRLLAAIIPLVMMPIAAAHADSIPISATVAGYANTSDGWANMTLYANPQNLMVSWYAWDGQEYYARAAVEFGISAVPSSSTVASAYFNIWG